MNLRMSAGDNILCALSNLINIFARLGSSPNLLTNNSDKAFWVPKSGESAEKDS